MSVNLIWCLSLCILDFCKYLLRCVIWALKAMKLQPKANTPQKILVLEDGFFESKKTGKPPTPPRPLYLLFNSREYLS